MPMGDELHQMALLVEPTFWHLLLDFELVKLLLLLVLTDQQDQPISSLIHLYL
jgi:hypothetical protein